MKSKNQILPSILAATAVVWLGASNAIAAGDPQRGKIAFRTCIACHSANPGVNKTGPSLANIWGKKAGTVEGFNRYSIAVKNSKIVWNDETLDAWLRNPSALVPNTSMRIRGVAKANERQDIVAFLKLLASGEAAILTDADSDADPLDLSKPTPEYHVTTLNLCQDTYTITMGSGEVHKFWEFNLRLKTDSSAKGPPKGQPILIGSGMRGDRASLVFASPAEISSFRKEKC
jgi:cytochrome c